MGGIALVAINAKFIHTNLAVRSVVAYARQVGAPVPAIAEFTVNQPPRLILERLVALNAELYVFSCYIWNIALAERLGASLKRLLPGAALAAAGPQVSYGARDFLAKNPAFDFVVAGEGERSSAGLFRAFAAGEDHSLLPGLVFRSRANPAPEPMDLDDLPFPYDSFPAGRIHYYESMRGCPYRCVYCLSSRDEKLRFRGLAPVFADFDRFLAAGVGQVKLVDRTFNCDAARALAIWRYLAERDNGVTNFHFELCAELLDDESLGFLAAVRPGLFQFEIGVQSCHGPTLAAINRATDLQKLFRNVRRLREAGNIHLHLDLIAGLPLEDFETFGRSFDAVYSLRPHQLQLGILKLLPGSALAERPSGLVCEDEPPFTVLRTDRLSFLELRELEGMAALVELFYNSGRFASVLEYLVCCYGSPFTFFRRLWRLYRERGHDETPLAKTGQFDLLLEFGRLNSVGDWNRTQWLAKYDLLRHEPPRKIPAGITVDLFPEYRGKIREYMRGEKQNAHPVRVEVFPFDPRTGSGGACALRFDYKSPTVVTRVHL